MRPMSYKGRQLAYNQWLVLSALLFWLVNLRSDGAMHEAVYGNFALRVDASTWAIGFVGAGVMPLLGILINGHWRGSPAIRIIGYLTQTIMFGLLAWSSLGAPFGAVIFAFTCGYFLPNSGIFLRLNVIDAIVRWKDYRDAMAVR